MLGLHQHTSETPFKWRFADGPMMARFYWYLDPPSPLQLKKTPSKLDPPTKLSGSAHERSSIVESKETNVKVLLNRNKQMFKFCCIEGNKRSNFVETIETNVQVLLHRKKQTFKYCYIERHKRSSIVTSKDTNVQVLLHRKTQTFKMCCTERKKRSRTVTSK